MTDEVSGEDFPYEIISAQSVAAVASDVGTELLYLPGESLFGVTGLRMRKLGWTVIPQERDGRRMPWKIDGSALKFGQYRETAPSIAETERWSLQAANANTAILLGPTSGNTFCLDIDVRDRVLAGRIEELADEVLGHTVFRRIGNDPKIALIYRFADGETLSPSKVIHFAEEDGTVSEDMVEVLSAGKLLTSHGHHHRTGRYFQWLDRKPTLAAPMDAALTDAEHLGLFIKRLAELKDLYRNTNWSYVEARNWSLIDAGGVNVPVIQPSATSRWAANAEGLVVDGREQYLWSLATETVRRNAGTALGGDLGVLVAGIVSEFLRRDGADRPWPEGRLRSEAHDKVRRAAAHFNDGTLKPWKAFAPLSGDKIKPQILPAAPQQDDTFGWVRASRSSINANLSAPDPVAAAARQINPDRAAVASEVADLVEAGVMSWLNNSVYPGSDHVHVLPAPTGAAKTTITLKTLATDPRTIQFDHAHMADQNPGPFVFLVTSYANMDELKRKAEVLSLDPELSDDELVAQALEMGLVEEGQIEKHISELRRLAMKSNLRTMTFYGKAKAGCKFPEKLALLTEAGIGTAGLCLSPAHGDVEETRCAYYDSCPAIAQRKMVQQVHVVFAVSNFLALSLPEELKNVRGIIADERVFNLVVHEAYLTADTLHRERKVPRLTKKEREAGVDPEDLLNERRVAAGIVLEAIENDVCPANALAAYSHEYNGRVWTGHDIVASARRVCGSAITSGAEVNPALTDEGIRELVERPAGHEIKAEYRLWAIIQDRLEALGADSKAEQDESFLDMVRSAMPEGALRDLPTTTPQPPRALGARDLRLKRIQEGEGPVRIRLAWRTSTNWEDKPLLLLDASNNKEITERIFQGRTVIRHEVDVVLNQRVLAAVSHTFANGRLVPPRNSSPEARLKAAEGISLIRSLASILSGVHANGRVVITLPKRVRKAVCLDWLPPLNVDFTHCGATRGLDFARSHVAVAAIGRLELPTSAIDSAVAALGYGDATPELAIDVLGNGCLDENGEPILPNKVRRTIPMRDGSDLELEIQEHAGKLAKAVQEQYREEEVRQILGRPRPVYRYDTTAAYVISQAVPEGVILDDVCKVDDLLQDARFWIAVRLACGLLDAEVMGKYDDLCTREEAQVWIDKLSDRVTRNYSRVVLELPDGHRRTIMVAGHLSMPGRHADRVLRHEGIAGKPIALELLCAHRIEAAEQRPMDDIERYLGDVYERGDREFARRYEFKHKLVEAKLYNPELHRFTSPDAATTFTRKGDPAWGTLDVWALIETMQRSWIYSDTAVDGDTKPVDGTGFVAIEAA